MTIDTARLPAAGLRQLTSTPPDAVLIVEASNPARASALVVAVRQQPLGALTPVIVHGEGIDPTLDVQANLASANGASEVLRALEEALEFEIGELSAETDGGSVVTFETPRPSSSPDRARAPAPDRETATEETSRAPTAENPAVTPGLRHQGEPARLETPKFILEEIIDEDPDGPRRLDRGELFGSRGRRRSQSDVDDSTVKRMLRSVRHEDYYAILGVHRGAETPAVRDAFYRQVERYDPANVDVDVAHRHHLELAEIRDALEDAWAVLGDSDLRTDYLDATTRT